VLVQADAQVRTGGEERRFEAVLDALRPNQDRQRAAHGPCGRLGLVGMAGYAIDRVQDAETNPVEAEGYIGCAVHAVADFSTRVPSDVRLPGEIQVAGLVASVEGDGKAVFFSMDGQVRYHSRDGVPVVVADGDVDAPDQLDASKADVAQVASLVKQVQVA
jgi:hypothetical protein